MKIIRSHDEPLKSYKYMENVKSVTASENNNN